MTILREDFRSCRGSRRDPDAIGVGSEEAKCESTDQVALKIERVVDGGMGGQESLGRTLGFELLLFAFSSSNDQV
jgi:hypothetical protein